ncbi:MAG: phosphotransferase [Candidatus Latescibacteria bacterium]|nr:phosphotransferase [Candidatus Latescibacterota bacterium]
MRFHINESRYFLKEWPDGSSEAEQFNLGLQAHLLERGFPVPKLLTAIDGEKSVQWGGRKISLYDYVGEAYDPAQGQEQRDACATALGEFHRVTTDFPLTGSQWKSDPSFGFSESFINDATMRLPSLLLSTASKRRVAGHLRELDTILQKAKERLSAAEWFALPHVPIHGDFCQFNSRFKNHALVGVVDWDTARLAPRILDVAHAMNIALGWSSSIDYYEDFKWQDTVVPKEREIVHWITQYRRLAPEMTDKEVHLLPLVCAAIWPAPSSGFEPKNEQEVENCEIAIDFMRHFMDEADAISKAIN